MTIHVKGINTSKLAAGSSDDESSSTDYQDIAKRITLIANYLKQDTLYLASQPTRELVAWHAGHRSNILVRKDHSEGINPATFTIIAIISTDGFFLTPDAYYKGST